MATDKLTEREYGAQVPKEWEEVDGDCGEEETERRGLKFSLKTTTVMGSEDGDTSVSFTGAGKECRIVYLDEEKGIWKCRHCSWSFKLFDGGMDLFQKHENNGQVVMTFKAAKQTQEIDDIEPVIISKHTKPEGTYQSDHNVIEVKPPTAVFLPHEDYNKPVIIFDPFPSKRTFQKGKIRSVSAQTTSVTLPEGDVQIRSGNQILVGTIRENECEVLKSIIYGGLIESITSLCLISAASGANTSTLNIVSLGLANLICGLLVMLHHLSEIKNTAAEDQNGRPAGRYRKLLGRRENFRLHASVSAISFIFFGLLPPLIYAFSSAESTKKESRLIAVAAASLACISLLAIGKARLTERRPYIKSLFYYLGLLCASSGVSYIAGVMIGRFLQQLRLFECHVTATSQFSAEHFGPGPGLTFLSSR